MIKLKNKLVEVLASEVPFPPLLSLLSLYSRFLQKAALASKGTLEDSLRRSQITVDVLSEKVRPSSH